VKKFDFRLQKVLEYRRMMETWAKDAYLDSRTARLEAEMGLLQLAELRHEALKMDAEGLDGLRSLEIRLKRLDEREIEQQVVVNVLSNEEQNALEVWTEKKVELEVLEKLYEKQYSEWQAEADRKIQNELDEWALRKKAA
jgi:flagellar export protein FliJ